MWFDIKARAAVLALLLPFSVAAFAKEAEKVDENAIFGDDETVVSSEKITDDKVTAVVEKDSVGFNGFLVGRLNYLMDRDWMQGDDHTFHDNLLDSSLQSNYSLDVRLRQSFKGFVNVSVNCYPSGVDRLRTMTTLSGTPTPTDITYKEKTYAEFLLNEIFIDFNIKKYVYFRIGKQVLKWGQGYFWTPTDMINIDKKSFLDPYQVRAGVYGLRLHVPFGTIVNFYSFFGFDDVKNWDQVSVASKLEVLIKKVEMSLSVAYKKGNVPVYGYDITYGFFGIDLRGEMSLSYGENQEQIGIFGGNPYRYKMRGQWIPKASVGIGKAFDVLDVHDRIRFDLEFFYNHSGYARNIFAQNDMVKAYFIQKGLYVPNYYGKYYLALFMTCNRLFVQDLVLTLNYMGNLSDYSSIVSGMLSYTMIYNLSIGLMLNGYIGKTDSEYTASGYALSSELSVRMQF